MLANDLVDITPGSGTSIATHLVGSKEHQVVIQADSRGHINGTAPQYVLFIPAQSTGASRVFFDLFNATGSGLTLRILSVAAIKDGTVAVTGVVAAKLTLTRTSAVGTGGTAATFDGTNLTAATISKIDPSDTTLPAGITARLLPTGGATAGAVISELSVFLEETSVASYGQADILGLNSPVRKPLIVPQNTGIRVIQGIVASVGSVGFVVVFEAV